jgi:hypothetical protein
VKRVELCVRLHNSYEVRIKIKVFFCYVGKFNCIYMVITCI